MKNSEIKALTLEELNGKIAVEVENYNKLKFAHAVTPIENPMKIRDSRRLIARLHTELSNKKNQQAD
ncbi:MAG: 50S ribosomal protein L29 [Cytophagales bacterium]|nr:50S ribosomal protein L29 [Cytophagales bacterium]